MAKPSKEQSIVLSQLKDEVLEQMKTIGIEDESRLNSLNPIPLAVLRRNATQRHGVTRFRRGANASELKTEDVQTVDLHPMCWTLRGMIMLDSCCIMSTYTHSEIVSMMLHFDDLNGYGLMTGQSVVVSLHNFYVKGRQHGCGCVQPATRSIHENEERTGVSDAEHAQAFSSTS